MSGRPSTEIVEIYLQVAPAEIAYVKFIFESYEGIAVVRTVDRRRAVIVLMVAADFVADARAILDDLRRTVPWREVAARPVPTSPDDADD